MERARERVDEAFSDGGASLLVGGESSFGDGECSMQFSSVVDEVSEDAPIWST